MRGGGAAVRRRYLESVGLFDERFFLYYEDTDLSWRGRAQGWRYVYVPESVVHHVHSASSVEGSRLFAHYVERNRLLTLTRNAPRRSSPAGGGPLPADHRRPTPGATSSARCSTAARPTTETVRRRLGAFGSYLALLPGVLRDRNRLRRCRTVSDRDVLAASSVES